MLKTFVSDGGARRSRTDDGGFADLCLGSTKSFSCLDSRPSRSPFVQFTSSPFGLVTFRERLLHTQEARGSSPCAPTITQQLTGTLRGFSASRPPVNPANSPDSGRYLVGDTQAVSGRRCAL